MRGLEFGRYKAVDDTLAHAVEAYTGIPNVFFTWVRRSDKRIRFEFLDNTVALGERPRTVAFGDNETVNILDVKGMLDIDRYGRVFVDATAPEQLYRDAELLAAEHNVGFLKRCVDGIPSRQFAAQASGRIYLRIESGAPLLGRSRGVPGGDRGSGHSCGPRGGGACRARRRRRRDRARCDARRSPAVPAPYDECRGAPARASGDQRVLPTLGVWGTAPAG